MVEGLGIASLQIGLLMQVEDGEREAVGSDLVVDSERAGVELRGVAEKMMVVVKWGESKGQI